MLNGALISRNPESGHCLKTKKQKRHFSTSGEEDLSTYERLGSSEHTQKKKIILKQCHEFIY